MVTYIIRRVLLMIPTVFLISILTFFVIELPPGDFVSRIVEQIEQRGDQVDPQILESLRERYGLDKPTIVRYLTWIGRFMVGDLGHSLVLHDSVVDIIGQRFVLTVVVALSSLMFAWIVAFPIGIYSAVRQYSFGDYFWTVVGFLGLAIPNFLLALVLMYLSSKWFGTSIGGLFSREYAQAAWSFGKLLDLLGHLWIPVIVVGTAGTAGTIRILRANLLDELKRPYVELARAKGVQEWKLIVKYPLRIAINPVLSTVGWVLPSLVSGTVITAVVLGLPTAGPVYLDAIRSEDMPLAGAFMMMIAVLTVVGTLLSDILLAIADPRIRYE
jgi:peptide/nickel transport system permease protein